ncbi:hypothetical protein [Musicola paradisiaca]|uniref:hypothetical protein n=1 Tax=Musicola paradisiaca TaxID=69223 RepID=UPI003F228051
MMARRAEIILNLEGLLPMLAIGYWLLAIGYWLLAIGYWLLAIGYWLLAIGYWLLAIGIMLSGLYFLRRYYSSFFFRLP